MSQTTRCADGVLRLVPAVAAEGYQSFRILAPLSTHWRPASCAEVGCEEYLNGWALRVQGLTEEDLHTAMNCGRRYRRADIGEGCTLLVFEAGQPCFRTTGHRVRVDRDERFFVTGGDWRGNPLGIPPREHTRAADWQEHFAEHQDRIHTAIERG